MALKDKLMTLEDFKAVRDVDVASNSAQFTEIKADLDAQTGVISKKAGYYINLTVDPVDISNPSPSTTGLTYAVVDCSEGDKFVINAVGATNGRAWGFLDSSNHVLSMADANATVEDLELTAPTNAVKLIINDKSDGTSYKVGNNLVSRVSEIEKGGSGLSDEVKEALLACFYNVEWVGTDSNELYNNLEEALYGMDFYNTYTWDFASDSEKLFMVRNDAAASTFDKGEGAEYRNIPNNDDMTTRTTFNVLKGKSGSYVYQNKEKPDNKFEYLIPIPKNAVRVTATLTPSTQYLSVREWKYEGNGNWTRGYETGWKQGVASYTFTLSGNRYISINCKPAANGSVAYNDSTYPKPSNVHIEFFDN